MTAPANNKKTSAKTATKRGRQSRSTQTSCLAKKHNRKKRKKGSLNVLASVFVAGIALACVLFWLFAGATDPDPAPMSGQRQPTPQGERKASSQDPVQKTPPQPIPKGGSTPGSKPALLAGQKDVTRSATKSERETDLESAVASALHDLHDLHSLPFEEPLRSILDERIRQVDYALAQTFWILHLPPGAMYCAVSEERYQTGEPYRYQEIDILPGAATANAFIATLRDCLAIWAEKASVRASGASTWTISVHGLSTHLLHLYPGLRSFPVSPPDQLPSGRATSRNTMPPRLRTSIEDPKLVIVIDDLGGNPAATRQLLELNYPVTLAFWPHGLHTRDGARTAHARGREILVHQPMEPLGYPKVKPGPGVLLSGMTEEQIRRIVQHSLATVPYASGLNNHMGSRFTQQKKGVAAVIRILKERGLFMLDSLTHSRSVFAAEGKRLGALHYQRNVFLDVTPTRGKILEEFRRAERIALLTGQAIAIGHPLPETLSALKEWEQLRNKHIRLVRLSDLRQD